ncbi:Dph6-related ATP pyrophosphatase [Pedobacter sandarakinus]|uniref:Dph6-related ATP pyrophosphatase n=1 Tax=Pedobacter sandarakinus TaxID=353156 RepID=UPI0022462964|nr:diphthine--ammonia ligase [Pedobacter sandarakinus]MCX2574490.1 diphthine--ammonia ligase [Pedobacter sandarakinus]
MAAKKICIFNWSGGKDSALALHYALQDPLVEIRYLVTTVTEEFNRVSMHGVRESLLIAQAESIGIPLYQIRLGEMPDMKTYDDIMRDHLLKFKAEGITHSLYGDIFLEDLRNYRESKLAELGLIGLFPLWKRDTTKLIHEFLALTYKTIIVCTKESLASFCGKVLSEALVKGLPHDIDPCGENGEFHTFVFEGPIFRKKIHFTLGEKVFRSYKTPQTVSEGGDVCYSQSSSYGFWYMDLLN